MKNGILELVCENATEGFALFNLSEALTVENIRFTSEVGIWSMPYRLYRISINLTKPI